MNYFITSFIHSFIHGIHLTSSGLVFPEIEESVDDWIHDGVDASEDEETSLNSFVQFLERLIVAKKPENKPKRS